MKNIKISYLYSISLITAVSLLLVSSCKVTQQPVDSKDLSYLYNPTKSSFTPKFSVKNISENQSALSVKFFAQELLFSEANPEGVPTAMMIINVKLYNISQGRVIADSAGYNLNIVKESNIPEYIYNIPLKVVKGAEYMAEVRIYDRLRLQVVQSFVPFNTLSLFNRYNFVSQGNFAKNELFNPVLRANEYVNLVYLAGRLDSIFINVYKPFHEVPDPPSMMLPEKLLDYEPDLVVALPYSDTLPIMFPKEGIYHCTAGRNIREGFTFTNFGSEFPTLTTPKSMIEPLAYIATADELDLLRSSEKPKLALDEFWLSLGTNVEKSRELIKIYYNRVIYSNYYFSSYKQGWLTERGMIYVIYGPPDKVYKTSEGENWGYAKPVVQSSWGGKYSVKNEYLFFNFKKRESVYSDNDFYLSRSETLVTYWDKAIASWRKGIVFRLDNPEGI